MASGIEDNDVHCTGWFQELNWAWFSNWAKINWVLYGRLI